MMHCATVQCLTHPCRYASILQEGDRSGEVVKVQNEYHRNFITCHLLISLVVVYCVCILLQIHFRLTSADSPPTSTMTWSVLFPLSPNQSAHHSCGCCSWAEPQEWGRIAPRHRHHWHSFACQARCRCFFQILWYLLYIVTNNYQHPSMSNVLTIWSKIFKHICPVTWLAILVLSFSNPPGWP